MLRWLRNSFLTGVVIATPLGVTLFLIITFVGFVDDRVKPIIPERYNPESYLPFAIPGLGVVIAVALLTLFGALAANIFGRTLLGLGERVVDGVPLVRNVYSALKQLVETIIKSNNNSFKEVVLVEYPMKGLYAVAFVTAAGRGPIKDKVAGEEGGEVVGLFVPTTPNPTSGFLLYTRRDNTIQIDMSVEEAAKLIISFGMVTPDKLPDQVQADLPEHVIAPKK